MDAKVLHVRLDIHSYGVAVPHVKCWNVEMAHNVSGGDGLVCRIP